VPTVTLRLLTSVNYDCRIMSTTPETATDHSLEERVRDEYAITVALLRDLRSQRIEIDATVRQLVVAERTQKRLIAVFDRAKAKAAKKPVPAP